VFDYIPFPVCIYSCMFVCMYVCMYVWLHVYSAPYLANLPYRIEFRKLLAQ